MCEPLHSSSLSGANATMAAVPKRRLNFFSKKNSFSVSRDEQSGSDKFYEPPPSDKIPTSPLPSDLELSQSRSAPSPDSFVGASHDAEFLRLRECIRKIKRLPSGTDPKKVDAVWEVYKKVREEALSLCRSLLQKSQETRPSLDSASLGSAPSVPHSDFVVENAPIHVNDQWLAAINEYNTLQASMLENLRLSLLATYKAYEPTAATAQLNAFLGDKALRKNLISKWRDESVHRMRSEKLLFWEQYKIRSLNYDRMKMDITDVGKLLREIRESDVPCMPLQEYVVSKNGDTILEFANNPSGVPLHSVLRFRVSSHLLAEASPLFAHFLMPHRQDDPPTMAAQLPPSPSNYTCKDGTEVKLYCMPQVELNKDDAFSILLHAAHMQHSKVPRQIEFSAFVSIADVCLRYRCTSPLELQVEYQWLPQWIHMIGDDNIDGFLLIGYAFGLRRIFTRMSKSAVLNAKDEEEIQSKTLWPQAVRDKIKTIRAAKIAQVNECCTRAVNEYFRPPTESFDRRTSIGSLQLTSVPRCPKNSHLCDATNLGWLMLVYNELQLLPEVFKDGNSHQASPKRSLKELVDCLRLMPSAPPIHSGMCDYAAAFRSDINDISNSVSGLTLRDVTGRNGWALSKHAGPTEDRYSDFSRDLIELEAPLEYSGRSTIAMSNEDISLRIMLHIDDLDDLNCVAMIDKTFYKSYKTNEAMLLRSVMRAERRRTISQVVDGEAIRDGVRRERAQSEMSLADIYIASPLLPPVNPMDEVISVEEAERILWPDEPIKEIRHTAEPNEKFRAGDGPPAEGKARIMDNEKLLRDEKDEALGLSGFF